MSQRRKSSSGDGAGIIGGCFAFIIAIALIWTAVRALWLFVIVPVWPLWVAVLVAVAVWVLRRWRRARRDPLTVSSERVDASDGRPRVGFIIQRRPWAKGWPEEARDGRTKVWHLTEDKALVGYFDPETEDESLLAERLSEVQNIADWWAYRMKGGADDVDKAVHIARELTDRGPNAKARKEPAR
jgi:hypothetical protein